MILRFRPSLLLKRRVRSILALLLYVLAACALVALAAEDIGAYCYRMRGVESGMSAIVSSPKEPGYGVNIALERYRREEDLRCALRLARLAGLTAVRLQIPWSEVEPSEGEYHWALWDASLPVIHDEGFYLVTVLNTSPLWARPAWEAQNPYSPPADMSDLVEFAALVAERYGGHIGAYQIWDQPNISPHWGSGPIDPAGYVDMLAQVSAAIRGADPDATIIAGSLAPNTETGGRNMSDVLFLREIYRLEASPYFDVLGAKPYGFWSGPYDRRVDPDVLNLSRTILLREQMSRAGDSDKPIWAMEGGWAALPADWRGAFPAQGSDTPIVQAARLGDAIERIEREWPWMGLVCLPTLQPNVPPDDPSWGFALLDPEGKPTALYRTLQERLMGKCVIYPGFTTDLERYLDKAGGSDQYRLSFWGSDIDLAVEAGVETGQISILVDAMHTWEAISLEADEPGIIRVTLGTFLSLEEHSIRLSGTPSELSAIRGLWVGRRQIPWMLVLRLVVAAILTGWCLVSGYRQAKDLPWASWWRRAGHLWARVPATWQIASLAACFVGIVVLPWTIGRLAFLFAYAVVAALTPDGALMIAVACIPLAPVTVSLGSGRFSLTEISVLVSAAACVWDGLLTGRYSRHRWRARIARLQISDVLVLALVLLASVTSFHAAYRREALREFRVVVLESAILYALVRSRGRRREQAMRLVDVLFLSGLAVTLYGLARYPSASGVIEAEGVRRARAFYGSPNNLALYLERILPLGVCVALAPFNGLRRWLYGVGAATMLLLTTLTYSRGALFLGVPAALLIIGLSRGGRVRRTVLGLLLVGLALVIPLMGVERLVSLLDTSQGTTFLRLNLWSATVDMIGDHPWLGVGLDNFLYYYGDYVREGAEIDRWLSHPHDLFLDFWARLGIGGLLVLVGLLLALVRNAWSANRPSQGQVGVIAVGLMAGMAAAIAHGLIDNFYFVPELACWFMFAQAWLVNASARS